MTPCVSIIVPTFNRAKILTRTLESIFNQTYKDYEVIVISNGSTDDTKDVIDSFKDHRLRYIFQKGSGSPASPRNTGIRAAHGDFIAFCDDDDLWLPDKLEKQVRFLQKHLDYDICCTKMKHFNEITEWVNYHEETEESITSLSLLYRNTIPLSSLIMRKKVFEDNELFDENKKINGSEDYELILRLSKNSKIFCIHEYLVLYYSGASRFSNLISSNSFKKNLLYLYRLYCVYQILVRKGFFRWSEIIAPLSSNGISVIKIILYDTFAHIKKKFF